MNTDITTILINAVVTILTTAIVIRLSLNKGKLGITNKFKESAKSILIKYSQTTFFVLFIFYYSYEIYEFIIDTKPITRLAIVMVVFKVIFSVLMFCMIIFEIIIFIREKRNP